MIVSDQDTAIFLIREPTSFAEGIVWLQLLSGLKSDLSMTTIYVGNLPFSATETDVRSLFEQHGAVQSVKLVNDRETGRPRGFGFVEMSSSDAQTAIQHMNGFDMGGRPLRVNEAREREARPPRQNGRW